MKNILFVILDGVGDRPIPQLNYTTTLESASTPNLDYFARKSVGGLVYTVGKGIAPESDIAVYSMLGYKVNEGYVGRGVVEALGCGLDFKNGDLALRGNFATIGDDFRIIDRRVARSLSSEESHALSKIINSEVKLTDLKKHVIVRSTIGHRCVVLFKADDIKLSDEVSNTDPAYAKVHGMGVVVPSTKDLRVAKCEPLKNIKEAKVSADLVNEFTDRVFKVLNGHELNEKRRMEGKLAANVILLRDAGNSFPRFRSLEEYYGLKSVIIADMPVEIGIAKTLKADVLSIGSPSDFGVKAEKSLELLNEYGLVYVHLKGPDEPGHDGDYAAKKKVVEAIDQNFFGVLKNKLNLGETMLIVSSDHATPCVLKGHSDDPVPFILTSSDPKHEKICRFTERDCSRGSYGTIEGSTLLSLAKSLLAKNDR